MTSRDRNAPALGLGAERQLAEDELGPGRATVTGRAIEGGGETAAEALAELARLVGRVAEESSEWIARMSSILVGCYSSGGKVLACGNGGSATQADHAAAELAGKFYRDRKALPALSLTDNVASLTAVSNDLGYQTVFSRQIEGLGRPGDVLMAFSTSGKSPNILEAVRKARDMGLVIVGFTGKGGSDFAGMCDHCLVVPSLDPARIQEVHLAVAHNICALAEAALFERG